MTSTNRARAKRTSKERPITLSLTEEDNDGANNSAHRPRCLRKPFSGETYLSNSAEDPYDRDLLSKIVCFCIKQTGMLPSYLFYFPLFP
jgi:hypothetical protein